MSILKLSGHVPAHVLEQLPPVMEKFKIDTPLRLAHFLAQCAHESGGFEDVTENLNYSAENLKKVFGKYFKITELSQFAHRQQRIASRVYANRMGNGSEASGDGWTYRGRGYIQLTGKENYRRCGAALGVDLVTKPDLVATTFPLASAAFFFESNRLWKWCDVGATHQAVKDVTKRVNGGDNGLADRQAKFDLFYGLLAG